MGKIDQKAKGKKPLQHKTNASLAERISDLQDRILARPPTGKKADKEFFDWLSGDE
jgi:hypothetical protein